MQVKIVNKSKHQLPEYSTRPSAGIDLRANIDNSINIEPMQRALISTGLFIELPAGAGLQ